MEHRRIAVLVAWVLMAIEAVIMQAIAPVDRLISSDLSKYPSLVKL